MRKIVVIGILVLLILGVSGGYYHLRAIHDKKEIRQEALLYFQEEDYQKAAELFEDARARKTLFSSDLDWDILNYLAESRYQLGDYDEALKLYDRIIRQDSGEARNYLLKGECLEKADRPEDAVDCYQTGYDKTDDSSLLLRMCHVYMDEKDYEKALACAEQGSEGDDRQAFLFNKIIIYEKSRDYESAFRAASDYVDLYPKDEKGKKEYTFLSTRVD